MRAVPLERGEVCRPYRWKQFIVLNATKQPAILCLHSRLKVRFKAWKQDGDLALIHEARLARTYGTSEYSFALSADFS